MCCVGGVVSYARDNARGLGFESHGTQRCEALFFLKLGGPLVPVGVTTGTKVSFSPGWCYQPGQKGLPLVLVDVTNPD